MCESQTLVIGDIQGCFGGLMALLEKAGFDERRDTLLAVGDVLALDAKVTLDDNALFRHAELGELRDLRRLDPPAQPPLRALCRGGQERSR